MTAAQARREQLESNLASVQARIERACRSAGRPSRELTLIAVTKFFPVADAAMLVEAGVTDLGESRDQDAAGKAVELPTLTSRPVTWHFVGKLQTNKARSVARYADLVHSVDRDQLVTALADGVRRAGRPPLPVLIQVNLDERALGGPEDTADRSRSRGGAAPVDVAALAERIGTESDLRLAGVMAVAPQDRDPDEAFAELARTAAELRLAHPEAKLISAGMSGDLEAAVRHGATHLRIGTALLGRREPTFG
jgi:pyridoxal phosphate enzyme (YggS family)